MWGANGRLSVNVLPPAKKLCHHQGSHTTLVSQQWCQADKEAYLIDVLAMWHHGHTIGWLLQQWRRFPVTCPAVAHLYSQWALLIVSFWSATRAWCQSMSITLVFMACKEGYKCMPSYKSVTVRVHFCKGEICSSLLMGYIYICTGTLPNRTWITWTPNFATMIKVQPNTQKSSFCNQKLLFKTFRFTFVMIERKQNRSYSISDIPTLLLLSFIISIIRAGAVCLSPDSMLSRYLCANSIYFQVLWL